MTPEQEVVAEIQAEIRKLSEHDQINVKCIVSTLQGILQIGGSNARFAFALVGAQLACD